MRAYICIQRGLQCCCLEQKAIPEPRIAEQQYCSPAFVFISGTLAQVTAFLYICAYFLEYPDYLE